MKNLSLISFVGVDIHTNLDEIAKFNSPIPCEWSVLYSDSKSKTAHTRYPEMSVCKDFLEWGEEKDVLTSIHLCGEVIQRYLNRDQDVMDMCDIAKGIQLNLNIAAFPDHEKLADDILNLVNTRNHKVILQMNKTKEKFMGVFLGKAKTRVRVLHDGSGGFGREIENVKAPNPNHFTGYAGGIKPENVKKIVDLIEKENPNNEKYYIDMESGVRTDNIFSLEKCRQVIQNLAVVE